MINEISKEAMAEAKARAKEALDDRVRLFKKEAKAHHVKMFDNTPVRYKKTWLDCYQGLATRNQAIRAKCYECVNYEDVQNNVGGCTSRTCPIWHYRPLQKKEGKK